MEIPTELLVFYGKKYGSESLYQSYLLAVQDEKTTLFQALWMREVMIALEPKKE